MPESFLPPVVAELGASTTGFTAGIEQSIALLRQFGTVAAEVSTQTAESFSAIRAAVEATASATAESAAAMAGSLQGMAAAERSVATTAAELSEAVPAAMGSVSGAAGEMASASNAAFGEVVAGSRAAAAALESVGTAAAGMAGTVGAATARTAAETTEAAAATAAAATTTESALVRSSTASTAALAGTTSGLKKYALGLAGAGVGAFETIKSASELQSEIVRLRTSAGETGEVLNGQLTGNLKLVSDGVKQLAVDTGTSTGELAEGLYKIESAGFHGAEGLKLLQSAAEGARAEGASLETVSNTLDSAMNSFGYDTDHVNGVMNAMVQTTAHGKASMEELSSALPVVMSKASAAGISLQEMLGAMATMTAQGVTARQAAQNLQATISHLADQKDPARKAFQSIGLDAQDLAQNLGKRGLTGTFDMVSDAITKHMGSDGLVVVKAMNDSKQATASLKTMMDQMSPSARTLSQHFLDGSVSLADYKKQANGLPGLQGNMAQQFLALAKNAEGFDSMLKNGSGPAQTYISMLSKMMGGSAGLNTYLELSGVHAKTFADNVSAIGQAAEDDSAHVEGFNEVQKTFGFQLSQLKETAATLGISIGTMLLPYAQKLVDALRDGVQWLNEHKTAAEALAAVIGGVLTLSLINLAVSGVKGAISSIGDMATTMKVAATAVRDFELAQKLAAAASKIMAIAQAALNVVMDANPIGLLIIGIAALVAGLIYAYNHCAAFRTAVQAAFAGVKIAAEAVWHALQAAWNGLVVGVLWVWHALEAAWNAVANVTSTVWNAIAGFFSKWWPLLLVIFLPFVAIIMAIWNHFHEAIIDTAIGIWNGILSFLTATWNYIVTIASMVWMMVHAAIIDPIMLAWSWMVSLWDGASNWLSAKWGAIKSYAALLWMGIKEEILKPAYSMWQELTSLFDQISGAIGDALSDAWHKVSSIGSEFMSVGNDIVMGIVHGVEAAGHWLMEKLKNLASDALDSAKSFLGINSPSKVFAQHVGMAIPEGIALGVQTHGGLATDAVTKIARQTVNAGRASLNAPRGISTAPLALATAGTNRQPTYALNITVQGSVLSERNLRDVVERQMADLGAHNPTTWTSYGRH